MTVPDGHAFGKGGISLAALALSGIATHQPPGPVTRGKTAGAVSRIVVTNGSADPGVTWMMKIRRNSSRY